MNSESVDVLATLSDVSDLVDNLGTKYLKLSRWFL